MERKLHRIPGESVIGGVAAGLATYFNIDKSLVRAIWVASLLLPIPPTFGWTIFIYLILWAILPEGTTTTQNFHSTAEPRTSQPEKSRNPSSTVKILGIALILFGAIMLIDELPIWYQIKEYFWPVSLIILGVYLLLNQRDNQIINAFEEPIGTPPPTAPKPETTVDPLVPDPNAPQGPSDQAQKNDDEDEVIKVN
jgi:phage shock protein C